MMADHRSFIVSPAQSGTAAGIVKIRVASDAVENAYTILELELAPDAGAPLHIHYHEDEIFHILTGVCSVQMEDRTEEIGAGSIVVFPKGKPHAFHNNGSEPVQILITAIPGGLDKYFKEIAAIDSENEEELGQLIDVINAKYQIDFLTG